MLSQRSGHSHGREQHRPETERSIRQTPCVRDGYVKLDQTRREYAHASIWQGRPESSRSSVPKSAGELEVEAVSKESKYTPESPIRAGSMLAPVKSRENNAVREVGE